MMEKNIGSTDMVIRVILAVVIAYMGYKYSSWWYILAVILFITALTGFCGLYKLLGIDTT